MTTLVQHTPDSRWISVVFLQGDQADAVLEMIENAGPGAAIKHLQQWDFGDETTEAALENGYVYDAIPAGTTDRTIDDDTGRYALTYSPHFGYVRCCAATTPTSNPRLLSRSSGPRRRVSGPWPSTPTSGSRRTISAQIAPRIP